MEVIFRPCQVCGESNSETIFSQKYTSIIGFENDFFDQNIVTCKTCGFSYTNPIPSEKELYKYYSNFSNYTNPQREGIASPKSIKKYQRTNEIISLFSQYLKNNGLVYIEVPNMLKPFESTGYFSFEHLNYFTPNNLISLMSKFGFQTKIQTFNNSLEIEPFYPVITSISRFNNNRPILINDYLKAKEAINYYISIIEKKNAILREKLTTILDRNKNKRIAIWGAGIHTSLLLEILKEDSKKIHCLFDNDKNKGGTFLNGIEIFSFNEIIDISTSIDCIIISSVMFEDEIYNQLLPLKAVGLEIYTLYKKGTNNGIL